MVSETTLLFAINLFVIALCGGLFLLMPRLTRKSYLFGVNIPPEQSNCAEAKAMKKRYTLTCLLGVLVILIVCMAQFITRREATLITTMYLPLLIIPIGLAAFVPNWKKALQLKGERGWQVANASFKEMSVSHTRGNLSALPWIWYVLSFIITVAIFVIAITRFPALPDMVAIQLDASLQPTRWVEKTWWSVLTMPAVTAATLALMILVAVMIEKAKLQIDQDKPRLSFAQHRVYRKRLGHALGFLTLIIILFMAILWLPFVFQDLSIWGTQIFWCSMVLIFIAVMVLLLVQFKTGQGGCKVKIDVDEDTEDNNISSSTKSNIPGYSGINDVGSDKYWILGMFYFNPDDPAYIVEDRFGTNIGFNYARLPVKIGVAILLLGLIALYVWLTKLIW